MSLFRRAKEVTSDVAAASRRQAQRGKLEVEVRRLESKVSSEKDAIGHALFPLLEAGTLPVDVAEVHERMRSIAELLVKIGQKRAEMEALVRSGGEEREETRAESMRDVDVNATAEAAVEQSAQDDWRTKAATPQSRAGKDRRAHFGRAAAVHVVE